MTTSVRESEPRGTATSSRGDTAGQADARWSIGLTLAVSWLLLFVIATFAGAHRSWPAAFVQDLWRWLWEPQIGGMPPTPEGLPIAMAVVAAVAVQGWLAARLVLASSRFEREPSLEIGLAIVLMISILGFGAITCVALGRLGRIELLLFYVVTGGVIAWAWNRKPDISTPAKGQDAARGSRRPRVLGWITAAVASVAVLFSLSHAAMSPVTEWDATIYHAETARLWFIERPDPALRYGPSIGTEISSNYPPLFPAAGAALYTLIGGFDDVYLRLLPPLSLTSVLLMLFGYARRRFDLVTANLSVLLVAGSPLTLAYGVWTTAYILLGALILAVVILVDLAVDSGEEAPWIGAGAVAGFAILCHFYGLLALLAPVAALATLRPRRWRGAIMFAAVAFLVAAPWLLRNLLLLRDPFYPLGTPPFLGRGLVEPLWSVSKDGIKNAALGKWGGATGPDLALRQLATSVFDREVLITGAYFGMWFGIVAWRRVPRAAYLAMFLAGGTVALLLPGWYWVRALVPISSVGALLTAGLLSSFLTSAKAIRKERKDPLSNLAFVSIFATIAATAVVCATVAVSLAVTGPSQRAMTAVPGDGVMGGVRIWGSPRQQLWGAFGGDLSMWEWLNQHLRRGERFATFEIRTYYLERPDAPFYLDGIEAVPLLRLRDRGAVERFLAARRIRFVVIPSWATHRHSDPMPLLGFLGSKHFPAVAAFPVGVSARPSVIYSVGETNREARLGFATTSQTVPPPSDQKGAVFPAGQFGNRIFLPMARSDATALRFEYDASEDVRFELNLFAQAGSRVLRFVDSPATARGWRTAVVPLPAMPDPLLDLVVLPRRVDLVVRGAHLAYPNDPIVIARQRRLEGGARGYRLAVGSGGRVYVPTNAERGQLRFEYLSRTEGRLRILVRSSDAGWDEVATSRLTGSRRWVADTVHLATHEPGFVEIWLKPTGSSIFLRAIDAA